MAKQKEKESPATVASPGIYRADATLARASGAIARQRGVPQAKPLEAGDPGNGMTRRERFEIICPNPHFKGKRAGRRGFDGVHFNEGRAFTNDEQASRDCASYGYRVIEHTRILTPLEKISGASNGQPQGVPKGESQSLPDGQQEGSLEGEKQSGPEGAKE